MKQWTQAERLLVLVDEGLLIYGSFQRHITRQHLAQFVAILKELTTSYRTKSHQKWVDLSELLLQGRTSDLRCPDWTFPRYGPDWALQVQTCGWDTYGTGFRFIGYDLLKFGYSPLESRERANNGDLVFAAPPYLYGDWVILSGTAHQEFAQFRLGHAFASPFADYRFEHPDTRWYNLASSLGTRRFFLKNAPQILDFFAFLIAQRLGQHRRVLLIAKKDFRSFCVSQLETRLRALGYPKATILTDPFTDEALADPHVLPLIHYGVVGINRFQEFECAFCLSGYYVNESVIEQIVHDVVASDRHLPFRIVTGGRPRRRRVEVVHPHHRIYDTQALAQHALEHQEMGVVLQAVGRVRPYTKAREIFTFQCAGHPSLSYTKEFHSLGEARAYFEIPTRRSFARDQTIARIHQAQAAGLTQRKTAERLKISRSTVKRGWASPEKGS